jgi:hypothetical protein
MAGDVGEFLYSTLILWRSVATDYCIAIIIPIFINRGHARACFHDIRKRIIWTPEEFMEHAVNVKLARIGRPRDCRLSISHAGILA